MIPFFASICCEAGAIFAPPHSNHWRPKSARRFSSCSRATYPQPRAARARKCARPFFPLGTRPAFFLDYRFQDGWDGYARHLCHLLLGSLQHRGASLNLYWTWGSACSFSSRTRPGQRSSEIRNRRRAYAGFRSIWTYVITEVRASASLEGIRPSTAVQEPSPFEGRFAAASGLMGNEASSPRRGSHASPSPALAALGEREREMKRERERGPPRVSFTAATSCLSVKGFGRKAYWPCSGKFFWNASSAYRDTKMIFRSGCGCVIHTPGSGRPSPA